MKATHWDFLSFTFSLYNIFIQQTSRRCYRVSFSPLILCSVSSLYHYSYTYVFSIPPPFPSSGSKFIFKHPLTPLPRYTFTFLPPSSIQSNIATDLPQNPILFFEKKKKGVEVENWDTHRFSVKASSIRPTYAKLSLNYPDPNYLLVSLLPLYFLLV